MTIGLTWRRTARRIKRLKQTVLAISPDYLESPDPRLFGALHFRLGAKALKRSVVKSLGPDEQVSKGQDREPKKQGDRFCFHPSTSRRKCTRPKSSPATIMRPSGAKAQRNI